MKKHIVATLQNLSSFPPGTVYYGDGEYGMEVKDEDHLPQIKSKKYEAEVLEDGSHVQRFKDPKWKKQPKTGKKTK